jgi:hypothetical protein
MILLADKLIISGSEHLTSHSSKHWATWLSCVGGCVFISFILAEGTFTSSYAQSALTAFAAIPFFGDLVNLIGATLGTFMCMVSNGWMWLFDNLHRRKTDKSLYFKCLVALNVFLIVAGGFIMITGTWAAAVSIRNSYATGSISRPFSCADNSNSS